MFSVFEIQTYENGTVGYIPHPATPNYNEALATYYSCMAAAAIATIPVSAVVLCNNYGEVIMHGSFRHEE